MASFADNYDRANGAIGASWSLVNSPNFQIVSNEVRQQTSGNAYRVARYATPLDTANGFVQATVRSGNGGRACGLAARMPDAATAAADMDCYVAFMFPGDNWYLERMVNGEDSFGAGVNIGTYAGANVSGTNYVARLVFSGTTISLWIDGVQRISGTDGTYAGGSGARSVGLLAYGGGGDTSGPYYDNFTAQDDAVVGGSTSIPLRRQAFYLWRGR